MITAAGAGASFCLATPARLRPQNQRNPRLVGQPQPSQTSLGSYNPQGLQLQRTQSASSTYSQATSTTYAPSLHSPSRSDRYPEVTEVSKSRPFFPSPLSPLADGTPIPQPIFRNPSFSASSAALYHDALLHEEAHFRPKSPGSLYSYMTASSEATARPFSSILEGVEPEELSDDDAEISPTSPAAPRQFQTYMTSPLPGLPSHVHNSQLDLQASFLGSAGDLAALQSTDSLALSPDLSKSASESIYGLDQNSQEICIVVLGVENSGKSTFIQKYSGSKRMPINGVSQRAYRFDDLRYVVRLVEMDLSALDIRNSNFTWPSLHDGTEIMTADGILVIFDVTDRTSMEKVPDVLDFFFKAEIPTLLVASKCDSPVKVRDLQPETMDEVKHALGVEVMETSSSDGGQSQKKCVSLMLSAIIQRKAEVKAASQAQANARRRTNSSAYSARSVSPRSDPKAGHGRASSELSISVSKTKESTEAVKGHRGRTFRSKSASNPTLLSPSRTSHSTPTSPLSNVRAYTQDFNPTYGKEAEDDEDFSYLNADNAAYSSIAPNFLRSKSTSAASPHQQPERIEHSASLGEIFEHEDSTPRMHANPEKYVGLSWEDLVTRLLAYPMSRADQDFATVMLCFFRKFAAPVDLLDSIIKRFENIQKDEPIFLLQMNEKIRILSRLHWWVWECPGDFANPATRQRAIDFAHSLESNRTFAGMAKDIIAILNQAIDDEDQIWGKKDTDSHRMSMPVALAMHTNAQSFLQPALPQPFLQPTSPHPRSMSVVSTMSFASGVSEDTNASLASPMSERIRKDSFMSNASLSPTLDMHAGMINMTGLLEAIPFGAPTSPQVIKEQYSIFMDLADEDIAHELTRIDWSLFSRIKPRDFVRHVSVPAAEKDRMFSLKYVNKLIRHFNHVAYWVANIILERPKAKHRARALEKFMNIAWILRHMNNYNSLGAVIAGVNGLAIHRLALTRSLVNEAIHKNFMRLELLMGTHKSHFAYRLALENTTTEHIPFIPLHRRDLVSADEGNRSFLEDGNRINWRKFEVMGDILLTLTNSQSSPHRDLRPNALTYQLISDATATMNDDQLMESFQELYERSVQLEPGNHPADMQRAKRGWFKR